MLTLIPTPIGNLQDITFRAVEAFNSTELFLCEDTRKTKYLIELLNQKVATCQPKADFLSFNEHNGRERLSQISSKLKDSSVVYVSDAGTPSISDPGVLLVEYCQNNGISYDLLPGATAVTTAYGASGFEGGKFVFWGFLPHKGKKRVDEIEQILSSQFDVIIYESPYRLLKLLEEISNKAPERVLFLAKELTKRYQSYYKDSAENIFNLLKNSKIRGEWVVVVQKEKNINLRKEGYLSVEEIKSMDIPPKIKAKILSKLTDTPIKEWYGKLTKYSPN